MLDIELGGLHDIGSLRCNGYTFAVTPRVRKYCVRRQTKIILGCVTNNTERVIRRNLEAEGLVLEVLVHQRSVDGVEIEF